MCVPHENVWELWLCHDMHKLYYRNVFITVVSCYCDLKLHFPPPFIIFVAVLGMNLSVCLSVWMRSSSTWNLVAPILAKSLLRFFKEGWFSELPFFKSKRFHKQSSCFSNYSCMSGLDYCNKILWIIIFLSVPNPSFPSELSYQHKSHHF